MEWVPRSEKADKLSKFIVRDDWSVSDECFQFIDNIWGEDKVHRFAIIIITASLNVLMPVLEPVCNGIQVFSIELGS